MTSAGVVGSTGLVGSNILSTLLSLSGITNVVAISRRAPPTTSPKFQPIIATDSTTWPTLLAAHTPAPQIFFSGLGTTRAAAGGLDGQRKIDVDLNLSLARAAHTAGAKIYVLISSSGANANSSVSYSQMKGELEDAVSGIGFEKVVLVRPGLIVGDREESRASEAILGMLSRLAGYVGLKDLWAQDAIVIARAAVKAGLMAKEGKAPEGGVWVLPQKDVVRLGKTEWKEEEEGK
ncbi:MAG: Protein fmp52, mitochondrial [Geoglossum umbratile]|nr:MAG: Protein fmp52, mitochondrial [Geoglossum umbratile]